MGDSVRDRVEMEHYSYKSGFPVVPVGMWRMGEGLDRKDGVAFPPIAVVNDFWLTTKQTAPVIRSGMVISESRFYYFTLGDATKLKYLLFFPLHSPSPLVHLCFCSLRFFTESCQASFLLISVFLLTLYLADRLLSSWQSTLIPSTETY